ncbi:MAG: CopD family protein [Terricaulis sp.]
MSLDWWAATLRFTHISASLFLLGALAFPLYARVDPLPRQSINALALTALGAGAAWIGAMALGLAAETPSVEWLRALLFSTEFGHAWLLHLGLTALLATLVLFGGRGILVVAIAGVQAASLALFGHSAVLEGWQGGALIAAHAAHVLGAGVWMGGALSLFVFLGKADMAAGNEIVRRFSRVGYAAVAAVALGGALNLRLVVDVWLPDIDNTYGALLTAKIALAGAIFALAAFNRLFASKPERRKILMRAIVAEHLLFLAVVLLAALVSAQAPHG